MQKNEAVAVVGATSGMGLWLARHYAAQGHRVGITGRRADILEQLCAESPMYTAACFDVAAPDAAEKLCALLDTLGNVTLVINAAGCGWLNYSLDAEKERRTALTNTVGFTATADTAFNWFKNKGIHGQIAAITSVAGTKGLGPSAAYSASKRYQSEYLTALAQLSNIQHLGITVTDIRPGFVATAFLDSDHRYPGLMTLDHVAPLIARAIARRRHIAVVDLRWRLLVAVWRRLPLWLWRRLPLRVSTAR